MHQLSRHTLEPAERNVLPTACGQKVNGYSAAVNALAYGANSGTGGACGRCFKITPTSDPDTPSSKGPFGNGIVVKVNDLCTAASNSEFCGQTVSNPLNHYNMPMQCVDVIPLLIPQDLWYAEKKIIAVLSCAPIRVLREPSSLIVRPRCSARTKRLRAAIGPVVMVKKRRTTRACPVRALVCGQTPGAAIAVRIIHLLAP